MRAFLLLIVVLASPPNKHQPSAGVEGAAQADQRGTQNAPVIVHEDNRPKNKEEADGYQEHRKEDEQVNRLNRKLSVWLAIVGFLQVIGIGAQTYLYFRQTLLMRKSLNVSRKAARIAGKSAEALIAAERGWLLLTPTDWNHKLQTFGPAMKTQFQKFPIAIKNVGKTPVRIKAFSMRYMVLDSLSVLPNEPNYPAPTVYEGRLLVPQDSYAETVVLEGYENNELGELVQALQFGRKHLYAYGYVEYMDEFNRKRETRAGFAYEYFWISGALHPNLTKRQAGPPSYNRAT
jgi:hypothetical protein